MVATTNAPGKALQRDSVLGSTDEADLVPTMVMKHLNGLRGQTWSVSRLSFATRKRGGPCQRRGDDRTG